MPDAGPLIRDISDTARWVAVYRAEENERPDALFRDPFARRLAGERGQQISEGIPFLDRTTWTWVARTWLFDRFIAQQVEQGAQLVLNLAAGLDARPYRMSLPASLQWVEVDLPQIIQYKQQVLEAERPVCQLERIALDLSDVSARRKLLAQLGSRAQRAVVVTEGLIIYLEEAQVAELARDLAAAPALTHWVLDLASPALLKILDRNLNPRLAEAGARLKFAPASGTGFFEPHGWRAQEVGSLLQTAARLKRLPFFLRLMAMLPDPRGKATRKPWGGVCLMKRT